MMNDTVSSSLSFFARLISIIEINKNKKLNKTGQRSSMFQQVIYFLLSAETALAENKKGMHVMNS